MPRRLGLVLGWLLLCLAAGGAWAEEAPSPGASPASNIEGWVDDDNPDASTDDWTWFGMGYESRISGNSNSSGAASGGAGAAGVGGARRGDESARAGKKVTKPPYDGSRI